MTDGPFLEIAAEIESLIQTGATCFQKFTCEACSARQTMSDPNVLFRLGKCAECQHVTNLETSGCGFMMIASNDPAAHIEFIEAISESIATSQPRNRN